MLSLHGRDLGDNAQFILPVFMLALCGNTIMVFVHVMSLNSHLYTHNELHSNELRHNDVLLVKFLILLCVFLISVVFSHQQQILIRAAVMWTFFQQCISVIKPVLMVFYIRVR